jgi:hypothetical protein
MRSRRAAVNPAIRSVKLVTVSTRKTPIPAALTRRNSMNENHLKNDLLIQWAINDGTVLGSLQPGGKAPPGNLGPWNHRVERWTDDGLRCD